MKKNKTIKFNFLVAGLILLVGIFIGGYVVLKTKTGKANILEQLNDILNSDAQKQEIIKDSDNDGLSDVLEELYGTDPKNPDTDGDGYLDGEEIFSGYDPKKPAPDDRLSSNPIQPRPPRGSFKNFNLTDELVKALGENFNSGNFDLQNSLNLEKESDRLVNNALQAALAQSLKLFALEDINDKEIIVSQDASIDAQIRYSEQMLSSLEESLVKYKFTNPKIDVIVIMLQAIQSNDVSPLKNLILAYQESYQKIKKIPVPSNWVLLHKKTLSVTSASIKIFEAVAQINIDPLKATLALDSYKNILNASQNIEEEGLKLIEQALK